MLLILEEEEAQDRRQKLITIAKARKEKISQAQNLMSAANAEIEKR
jgi:hypothetical protein